MERIYLLEYRIIFIIEFCLFHQIRSARVNKFDGVPLWEIVEVRLTEERRRPTLYV